MPSFCTAEETIDLMCFSNVSFVSKINPRIRSSLTFSRMVSLIEISGCCGWMVRDLDNNIALVLERFNSMPHNSHQAYSLTKSLMREQATLTRCLGDGIIAIKVESSAYPTKVFSRMLASSLVYMLNIKGPSTPP